MPADSKDIESPVRCAGNLACFCLDAPIRMNSVASGRSLQLSTKNRKRLETIWNAVPDKFELAKIVFSTILRRKPSLCVLWGIDENQNDIEEMLVNERINRHAKSFAMFLGVAVGKLRQEPADLVSLVRNVGKRHANYRAVSFDAENWLLFKNSVLDALEPYYEQASIRPKAGRDLWNKFLMFLIMEMKHAFYMETSRKHSSGDIKGFRKRLYSELKEHYNECSNPERYQ